MTGDPTFLPTLLDCVDTRCRILGLNAPTSIGISHRSPMTTGLLAARPLRAGIKRVLTESPCGGNSYGDEAPSSHQGIDARMPVSDEIGISAAIPHFLVV
jgi:hypothetical protein